MKFINYIRNKRAKYILIYNQHCKSSCFFLLKNQNIKDLKNNYLYQILIIIENYIY